jgi:hypothetical protein
LLSCVSLSCVFTLLGAGSVLAHHTVAGRAHTMATVRITQSVFADGKALAPGTYEVIITDEHPAVPTGAPAQNQRWVEFVQNGQVIGREIAEVFLASERPVGTAGPTTTRAVVQRLRGDEFVRIVVSDGGARYLIHLPTGQRSTQP